jgi:hypothetical protein
MDRRAHDWSTGSTGDPSLQRGACLRKIELSVARGIWEPFTVGWTMMR